MGRRRTVIAWTLGAAGALLVVFLAAAALLPRLISLDSVKSGILAAFSRSTGGTLTYERMDLVFLPRPRVVVRRPAIAFPGAISGAAKSLALYPEILPLLTGTLRVARIDATAPFFTAPVPARGRKPEEPPPSLAALEGKVASLLADAASRAPGLVVTIREGRLDLTEGARTLFSFREIEGSARLPPDALAVRFACRSSFFERLSATAALDPRAFTGQATIEATRIRPRELAAWLSPEGVLSEADSVVDLAIAVRSGGIGVLEADVRGATSALALSRRDRSRTLKSVHVSGTVRFEPGTTTVALRELAAASPKVLMSGRLLLDRNTPRAEADATIRDADLSSVRDAALALAGDVPGVRRFFDVVRAGRVPLADIRIRADSAEKMGKPENIAVTARLADGSIHVPGAGLDLESAGGEISLARGILEGRRLSARMGNSSGRDGSLTLGLAGKTRAFRLDAMVRADLSELPPLLSRLVGTGAVRDELSRIDDLRGEADGRLVLGDNTASIGARVDVSGFRLSGRYRRIPFPVAVSGGRVSWDGEALVIHGLDGTVGSSSATGLDGRFAFRGHPAVESLSGTFSLALGELHPWLASRGVAGEVFAAIRSLEGKVDLSLARLQGPLLDPGRWRFTVSGEARNLAAVTTRLPGRVEVDTGAFRAAPESLSFTGVRGRLLDASFSASGSLRGAGDQGRGCDLSLDGDVGPEAVGWISDLVRLPPALRLRPPVALSGGRLTWNERGATSFSGTLGFRDGPAVSLALRKDAAGLAVDKLAVQGMESDAAIALRLGGKTLSAKFAGTLTGAAVDRILVGNTLRRGRLSGDMEADVRLDDPARSSARGTLEVRDLAIGLRGGNSLAIETVSLAAQGNVVRIGRSAVTFMAQHILLAGEIRFPAGGVRLDLDVASEGLDADRILSGLLPKEGAGQRETDPAEAGAGAADETRSGLLYGPPVSGVLRLKAGLLRSGRFTWSPFAADISLSPESVTVSVTDAVVCGIATPGTLSVTPRDMSVDFRLVAANREIEPVLACLAGKTYRATGRFTLRARASGRGAGGAVMRSLKGDFDFEAAKGRIHALNLLSKILAVVNLSEMFRGRVPDLGTDGFAYNEIRAKGTLEDGKIVLSDGASLDGASMGLTAHGTVDLRNGNLDMVALVAPLRTVDAVVRRIPVLRYILGGSLVSIPVAIRGDLDDPKISVLPAAEIGAAPLRLLERILNVPVKIIAPVIGVPATPRSTDHQERPYQP